MPSDLATSSPSTSTVTLTPTYHGHIPGDANDGADFWGAGLALVLIVVAIALVRWLFRSRHQPGRHVRSR